MLHSDKPDPPTWPLPVCNSPFPLCPLLSLLPPRPPPSQPLVQWFERANSFDWWIKCNSLKYGWTTIIVLAFEAILLLYGAMLSYLTRNVKVAGGEAKWIAITVYNLFLIAAICLAVLYGLQDSINPTGQYVITSVCQLLGTLLTVCLIFVPKFLNLNTETKVFVGTTGGGTTSETASGGQYDEEYVEKQVQQAKKPLQEEIKTLKNKLKNANSGSGVELAAINPGATGGSVRLDSDAGTDSKGGVGDDSEASGVGV